MNENIFLKFRDKFLDEANTLLDQLEKDLLELEKDPGNNELLESAFRAMHTIKGVSGMYGFEFIAEITHILENIFQLLRERTLGLTKEITAVLFSSIDHIRKLLEDEKLILPENKINHERLLTQIASVASLSNSLIRDKNTDKQTSTVEKKQQTWYIIINANEHIFFRGINLTNIFKELAQLGEFYIQKIPVLSYSENDSWGVVLVSDCSLSSIQDVLLFIEDNCQIFRITKDDIFQKQPLIHLDEEVNETQELPSTPSILEMIAGQEKIQTKVSEKGLISEASKIQQNLVSKHQTKRISVDASKLDQLMYLVSELITVNSQLTLASKGKKYEELRPFIESVDGLSKKFRSNAFEIRLVPLRDIALRLQRLIRDLAVNLNKKIEFEAEGIDTELDKNTIDMLAEPLMHIIRNCIDHGIEVPENRKAQGKSETGVIKLSALQSGNHVYLSVSDDGNGIDLEKVRIKAVEKGILQPTDKPIEKDIFNIIFMPGFSTAVSLTEVSGRGVGMDVVKRRIADLRGEIIVNSISGKGTTFTIKLEQSLTILDTLLFMVQDTNFIVPIGEIEICVQENADYIFQRLKMGTIPYNNQLIHFIDLRQVLNLEGKYKEMVKILIIKKEDTYVALLADRIIGEHQAVIKPLGHIFIDQNIFIAASQLGDGNLAFMLDTAYLCKRNEKSFVIN